MCVSNSCAGSYPYERSIWTDFLQSLRLVRKRQVHWSGIYFHPLNIPIVTYNKIHPYSGIGTCPDLGSQNYTVTTGMSPWGSKASNCLQVLKIQMFQHNGFLLAVKNLAVLSCIAGRRPLCIQLLLNVEHLKVCSWKTSLPLVGWLHSQPGIFPQVSMTSLVHRPHPACISLPV